MQDPLYLEKRVIVKFRTRDVIFHSHEDHILILQDRVDLKSELDLFVVLKNGVSR